MLLLLALVAAGVAFYQRALARARELVSASNASQDTEPALSILTGAQSIAVTWPWGHTALPGAEEQLRRAILASHLRVTLRGHSGWVSGVAWSPDRKRLATASEDATAKVWDAASGADLVTLRGHSGPVTSVAWSPDGRRLATGSSDSTVQIYAMDIHDLMALACERILAQPSVESCKQYLRVDKCPPCPVLPWW